MRMWNIPVELLCRKHLMGEHVEIHMFVGAIQKKKSLKGYVRNNLLELSHLRSRHDDIAFEMFRRGYNHKSPLPKFDSSYMSDVELQSKVNVFEATTDLVSRCAECRSNIFA